jgi:hypothetical protein
VTSWQYWIAVSKYAFHDGLIYVDPDSRRITEAKRLWALGNYSRFVRPGDVRVAAHEGEGALQVAAFRSALRDRVCAVVINTGTEPVLARLSIAGGPTPGTMRAYETSRAHDLEQTYEGLVPEAHWFAPRSVTTLVLR